MKVYIADQKEKKIIYMKSDSLIKELYDTLNEPSAKELYFRSTVLDPNVQIKKIFPYYIPKVYLYTKYIQKTKECDMLPAIISYSYVMALTFINIYIITNNI
jgi:hypothetical protein